MLQFGTSLLEVGSEGQVKEKGKLYEADKSV